MTGIPQVAVLVAVLNEEQMKGLFEGRMKNIREGLGYAWRQGLVGGDGLSRHFTNYDTHCRSERQVKKV